MEEVLKIWHNLDYIIKRWEEFSSSFLDYITEKSTSNEKKKIIDLLVYNKMISISWTWNTYRTISTRN